MAKYGRVAQYKIDKSLHEYKYDAKPEGSAQSASAGSYKAPRAGENTPPKPKND